MTDFRIADTFTDSLARLARDEQKAAKITAIDLQMDPSSPGLQFHRIDKSKDPNFWSLRINRDLRLIVHKTAGSILLCYVDHHDKAYGWAERRRIEAHPRTSTIQIVEIRERVEEIAAVEMATTAVDAAMVNVAPRRPFETITPEGLLAIGVPTDWVATIRGASEDTFLDTAMHLPPEAAEALLQFAATGMLPVPPPAVSPIRGPDEAQAVVEPQFDFAASGDTLRRFRVVENAEELEAALAFPWERWAVFLHPSQQEVVERTYSGPAKIAGSAGTGKTVVAIHRAARLARSGPDARVLLTTFSRPLANALERKLKILLGEQSAVARRITVAPFHGIAEELYQLAFGRRPRVASDEQIRRALSEAQKAEAAGEFSVRFLASEWANVVDAWQIISAEGYAEVPRLGRKNRLGAKQRERLWPVFAKTREILDGRHLRTWPSIFAEVTEYYAARAEKPFTHIVVDEAQDLGVPELRFLAGIAATGPDAPFFAGDLGQRIFQQPFSWKGLGVDIRGRSQTLKVNYRTSHQIRQAADRLLPNTMRDVDGVEDDRSATMSVFNGPEPQIEIFPNVEAEAAAVGAFITTALSDGIAASEIGVFVRTRDQLPRARVAIGQAGQQAFELSERGEDSANRISIGTMHLAKGLEFKVVAVMACDDEVLPLQSRVEAVADEVELDDIYETERQLFYVACTRARDRLLVTGVSPGSEFLGDIKTQGLIGRPATTGNRLVAGESGQRIPWRYPARQSEAAPRRNARISGTIRTPST